MDTAEYDILHTRNTGFQDHLKQIYDDAVSKLENRIDRFTRSTLFLCLMGCMLFCTMACLAAFSLSVVIVTKTNGIQASMEQASESMANLVGRIEHFETVYLPYTPSTLPRDETTIASNEPVNTTYNPVTLRRREKGTDEKRNPYLDALDKANPDAQLLSRPPCHPDDAQKTAFIRGNVTTDSKTMTIVVLSGPHCPSTGTTTEYILDYTVPTELITGLRLTETCDVDNGILVPLVHSTTLVVDPYTKKESGINLACKCKFGNHSGWSKTRRNLREIRLGFCILKMRLHLE